MGSIVQSGKLLVDSKQSSQPFLLNCLSHCRKFKISLKGKCATVKQTVPPLFLSHLMSRVLCILGISFHFCISVNLHYPHCVVITRITADPSSPLPILSWQVSDQLCSSSRGGHWSALWPVCGAHTVQDMEAHEKLPLPKYVYTCGLKKHRLNINKNSPYLIFVCLQI